MFRRPSERGVACPALRLQSNKVEDSLSGRTSASRSRRSKLSGIQAEREPCNSFLFFFFPLFRRRPFAAHPSRLLLHFTSTKGSLGRREQSVNPVTYHFGAVRNTKKTDLTRCFLTKQPTFNFRFLFFLFSLSLSPPSRAHFNELAPPRGTPPRGTPLTPRSDQTRRTSEVRE